MNLTPKAALNLKQMQRLIMSRQMQQALQMLQSPVMELSALIEAELEQNPILEVFQEEGEESEGGDALPDSTELREEENTPEKALSFSEHDFEILLQIDEDFRDYLRESGPSAPKSSQEDKLHTWQESSITAEPTLFENLMRQASEEFSDDELKMAEAIIGSFDQNGFLATSLQEIAKLNGFEESALVPIVNKIKDFDPPGVGAVNLQEALLIQLKRQGHQGSLAYEILENYYQDLIHNRVPEIRKKIGCSLQEISAAIKEDMAKLDFHPGTVYSNEPVQTIIPDVILKQEGDELTVIANDEPIPSFRINHRYLRMLEDESLSPEAKEFIKEKLMSAKWLMRNLFQRSTTLEKITTAIAEKQKAFFLDPSGKLNPMTMKILAEELSLHESTIARAVAGKYVDSPRGIFPLRSFFTNAYTNEKGEDISSQTVREALLEIIRQEDKKKPLSDEAIAAKIKSSGIPCARRTVAKYRAEMQIGNAHQRKQFY
jgi:RNA polymerase sigma-54 factor